MHQKKSRLRMIGCEQTRAAASVKMYTYQSAACITCTLRAWTEKELLLIIERTTGVWHTAYSLYSKARLSQCTLRFMNLYSLSNNVCPQAESTEVDLGTSKKYSEGRSVVLQFLLSCISAAKLYSCRCYAINATESALRTEALRNEALRTEAKTP